MKALPFIYNGQTVDFEPSGNDNVMVNATQMAKIFGKLPKDFLKTDETKAFIIECLKKENSPFLGIEKEEDLVTSVQKSGTWMHRILALKFAAWLDPSFELWVFITIDKILNHYFREQQQAMIDKLTLRHQKEAKKIELLEKYPELNEYFKLEESEREANARKLKAAREQFKQLELEFEF